MTNIWAEIDGCEHIISGDFAQASSPLYIDGSQTPYQVADARHCLDIAVAICLDLIGEAKLPTCPVGMTPGEWRNEAKEYEDWGKVHYREATEEEVERIESED